MTAQPRVGSWKVLVLKIYAGLLCDSGRPFEPPPASSRDCQGRRALSQDCCCKAGRLSTASPPWKGASGLRVSWASCSHPPLPWKMRIVKGSSEKRSSCGGGSETARPQPPTFGPHTTSELSACSSFLRKCPSETASALSFYPFLHVLCRKCGVSPRADDPKGPLERIGHR